MATNGPQNGQPGLESGLSLSFWALPSTFAKLVFYPSTPSMRKGRDGEWKKWRKKNNGENSGPLTSLQVDRLTATDCNAAARANMGVERSIWTSGMQPYASNHPRNWFKCGKYENCENVLFPLYFLENPLYFKISLRRLFQTS